MRALGIALLASSLVVGCEPAPISSDAALRDAGRDDAGVECADDGDCDDAVFCNGAERCEAGACVAGRPVRCDDGVECTLDRCVEDRGACVSTPPDADGDGDPARSCVDLAGTPLGGDCDDADAARFSGNAELCDAQGRDEDCDPTTVGARDEDGDRATSSACCNGETCGTDCDDARDDTRPGASETCNGLDDDCDGTLDEDAGMVPGWEDADRDGHGDAARPVVRCPGTVGIAPVGDDCDDARVDRHPGQVEICDAIDNDCDTRVDESPEAVSWYADEDGDGFGDASGAIVVSCEPVAGHALLATDCDDASASVSPAAAERCNAIDDDCNGAADFTIAVNDREDDDGDRLADVACGAGAMDCDDRDASAGPGSDEACNGRDDDCDTRIDEGVTDALWYVDVDGDGYGSSSGGAVISCGALAGRVRAAGDCDDADAARRPGAGELCDGDDDDCDATVDEAPASDACGDEAACIDGACRVTRCPPLTADCNADASDGCEQRLDTALHCGACDAPCAGECAAGRCLGGSCPQFFGDCDRDSANGCETPLDTLLDCGECGRGCALAHASASCALGACEVAACEAGFGDCDGVSANGCEQSLTSALHCGACGVECGAGAACSGGRCVITSCPVGTADCNDDATDGCEATLASDGANCGECGRRCDMLPGALATSCAAGRCTATSCAAGFGDCDLFPENGCESELRSTLHCGACGVRCEPPGALGRCDTGTCAIASCTGPFGDCNGVPEDGCERRLDTTSDCGACGSACTAPGALTSCATGSCDIVGCATGLGNCDGALGNGCETRFASDVLHCGACGRACGVAGACRFSQCDGVTEIASGGGFTCVLREGGGVACAGDGLRGQLGSGSTSSRLALGTLSPPITDAVAIAAGIDHACAIGSDGAVRCWGDGTRGQIGSAIAVSTNATALLVPLPVTALAIAAGEQHTCALLVDDTVHCWGRNAEYQARGALGPDATTPVPISGPLPMPPLRGIAAGGHRTCVWSDFELTCWGDVTTPTPLSLPGFAAIMNVSMGRTHDCALRAGDQLYCWGANDSGQLGLGTSGGTQPPTRVPLSRVRAVSALDGTTCIVGALGEVRCVGRGLEGQLGNGASTSSLLWTEPMPRVSAYVLGRGSRSRTPLAWTGYELRGWGDNTRGQLGLGHTMPAATPRTIPGVP